ncbi:hypothetical protein TrLO_g12447 [Triparma laevis f. longispina]|uniref:PAS domain-containing protein n=1 Tax=Triparma laevis f. longispina TaxID=1714387 RepID=A0A9W7A5G1_9STRA|nr:hypothetical protein TrLO_g12447 [Triparma laevis f. longispina]
MLMSNMTSTETNLSFSSPESDFSMPVGHAQVSSEVYSTTLSFSSPESDFTAFSIDQAKVSSEEYSTTLSFSSPESDFTASIDQASLSSRTMDLLTQTEEGRSNLAYSLSFSSPEADFSSLKLTEEQTMMMNSVEQVVANNMNMSSRQDVTIEEAFAESEEARVITELQPPFRIKSVNKAWVNLCGFSPEESMGKHLGILQGDKTSVDELDRLTAEILAGVSTEAKLVNYTKEGREFHNQLKIAFVVDELTKERVAVMGTLKEMAA